MLEWNPNAPPIRGTVNVGCRQTADRLVYKEVVEAPDFKLDLN